jgi:hypothetical protein
LLVVSGFTNIYPGQTVPAHLQKQVSDYPTNQAFAIPVRLCWPLWSQQTMPVPSQYPIDGVIALQKRNHWYPSFAKVLKRLADRTPKIHNKSIFGLPVAEVLQAFHDRVECGDLLLSPFLASARVGL